MSDDEDEGSFYCDESLEQIDEPRQPNSKQAKSWLASSPYIIFATKCLHTVFAEEKHLFNKRELNCLYFFLHELSDHGRYLFMRLYLRRPGWITTDDYLKYGLTCDAHKAVEELSRGYHFVATDPDFNPEFLNLCANQDDDLQQELTDKVAQIVGEPDRAPDSFIFRHNVDAAPLKRSLGLVPLKLLRQICKDLKIQTSARHPPRSSVTKNSERRREIGRNELIAAIAKSTTQPSLSLFFQPASSHPARDQRTQGFRKVMAHIKTHLGDEPIHINPVVCAIFHRAFLAYFRARDFDAEYERSALLAAFRLKNFPEYPVSRTPAFFPDRKVFLEYERASDILYQAEELLTLRADQDKETRAHELYFGKIHDEIMPSLFAASFCDPHEVRRSAQNNNRSLYYTPEWIGVGAAIKIIPFVKTPEAEWTFYKAYLGQKLYHARRRGTTYDRMAKVEMNDLAKNTAFALSIMDEIQSPELEPIAKQMSSITEKLKSADPQTASNLAKLLEEKTKHFWYTKAMETCVAGLQDSSIHEVAHIALKRRITRLESLLKVPVKDRLDFSYDPLIPPTERTIGWPRASEDIVAATMRMINQLKRDSQNPVKQTQLFAEGSEKALALIPLRNDHHETFFRPLWQDLENPEMSLTVEGAALQYYQMTFGYRGVHSENAILATFFALLFWDILFSDPNTAQETEIDPDDSSLSLLSSDTRQSVFQHHCQSMPLDLFSSSFYANRKSAIDKRLEQILSKTDSGYSPEFILNQIKMVHDRESPRKTICVGLAWYDLEDLLAIAEGLGPQAMHDICLTLAKDYRTLSAGMPDLILWNPETKEVKFSEVKSEHDHLSERQMYWINVLKRAGVEVELCKVYDTKTYEIKQMRRIYMPFQVFKQRIFTPIDKQSVFAQRTNWLEFGLAQFLRWSMSNVKPNTAGFVFYSKDVWTWLYRFRRWRSGASYIGDTIFEPYEDGMAKGVWIRSPQRGKEYDVVIYYVHGGGHVFASPYLYLEFYVKLIYSLQFQGFRNPAVFALEYGHIPMTSYAGQLSQVSLGWNLLKKKHPQASIVLMGDSNGASLGLGLLLHITRPAYHVTGVVPVQPDAAIFISPVCKSFSENAQDIDGIKHSPDFMLPYFYKSYGKLMKASTMSNLPQGVLHVYENPGMCRSMEWWAKAIPSGGVLIMHGEEELLSFEIEELYNMLSKAGNCRIAASPGQLHSWPMFQMMAGRTIEDREQGIEDVSLAIGHMVLWKDMALVEREEKFEQFVLKKLRAANIV